MATQVQHPMPMTVTAPAPQMSSSPTSSVMANMHAENTPIKQQQTPSPSATSSASLGAPVSNSAKRPPRKSTLTQQQKNQKRQRATADQLGTLELEFNKNPTPTAGVREKIAEEINMTERSVQIWFQNRYDLYSDTFTAPRANMRCRRAKIKLLAKKSLETGEDIDSIPESMRAYLAMQAMESGKGLGGAYLGRDMMPFAGSMLFGEQGAQGKVCEYIVGTLCPINMLTLLQ